jgi:hypothetical protein
VWVCLPQLPERFLFFFLQILWPTKKEPGGSYESGTDLVKALLSRRKPAAVCAQRAPDFLLKSTSCTKIEPDPGITLNDSHTYAPDGNCAQCSTELSPMIELCVQGSIKPWTAWLVPLLEQGIRGKGWKSVLPPLHQECSLVIK